MPGGPLISIRRAVPQDARALSEVGSQSFASAYGPYNDPADIATHLEGHYSPGAISEEMEKPDRFYLLALVDHEPAGLCKLRIGSAPDAIPERACIEVQQLYVLPGHQRRGLGERLIDATVAEAKQRRLAGIWLGVWDRANWARAFYEKCGFDTVGSQVFRLASSEQVDFLMWRNLSDG